MRAELVDPSLVSDLLEEAADALLSHPGRRGGSVHLPDSGRLLVTGDIHDHPVHFDRIRSFSHLERPDQHVVLHELIHGDRLVNGVDLSYRMLAKVAWLVTRHPEQVHPILANHELAQAFRQPLSKGAGENVSLFDAGLEWAFGDDAQTVADSIESFVRAMPLALRCANGAMVSHSLPGPYSMPRFDPGVLERDLVDADYVANSGSAWMMVWGRGQTPEQVEQLASRWNVELFLAGHMRADAGVDVVGPRLVILNSDHEGAVVLPMDLSKPPPRAEECPFQVVPVASLEALT